jgi:hypothetical protein
MNWKELKDKVDMHLQGLGVDEEIVEIDYIDINWCEADELEIGVTQGSYDRIEMAITA